MKSRFIRPMRLGLLVLMLAAADVTRAQQLDVLAAPLREFRDLNFDAAAAGLRALLAVEGVGQLSSADRQRALVYLGAAEHYRGRRFAAIDAFRTVVLADPRFRIDAVEFPPEVTEVFGEARVEARATSVLVDAETRIVTEDDRLRARIYAAGPHPVRVTLIDDQGGVVRLLHDGMSGDSLAVTWNGRDGLGRLRDPGRYALRVTSRNPEGRDEREVEVALTIESFVPDTLPSPAPLDASALRQEMVAASSGIAYLTTGLVGAGIVAALPSLVGADVSGSGLRLGVAVALGAAGVLGRNRAASPRPIPEAVEWNRRQRSLWSEEVARVSRENAVRRAQVGVRIRAAAPIARELK